MVNTENLLFVFPGARQQHLDRIEVVEKLGSHKVDVLFGFGQEYGISTAPKNFHEMKNSWSVCKKIKKIMPEIIFIAGWYHWLSITSIFTALYLRIPICIMSESTLHEQSSNIFKKFIKRLLMSSAKCFLVGGVAQNEQVRYYIKSPQIKIFHGYNSKKIDRYNKHSNEKLYNLFVGQLTKKKNVDVIIDAYHLLVLDGYKIRPLHIVGDGPLRKQLEDKVIDLKLDKSIIFEGSKFGDELIQKYNAAYVTIIPSLYEQWPFVSVESLASGTPVILSETVGCFELCKHAILSTGLTFNPTSARELCQTIKLIDMADYDKLSENCLITIKPYDAKHMFKESVEQIISMYSKS